MMRFVNPPSKKPLSVSHHILDSDLMGEKIGFNIYIPPDYDSNAQRYPVIYHLHGFEDNESSDLWALEKVYTARQAITVFVNNTAGENGYGDGELLMESTTMRELIPYIDAHYRTDATRGGRSLSGWSMGGACAFYYAVKYLSLFSAVTAYSGTFQHFFYSDYPGLGEPMEKAPELYASMGQDDTCFDRHQVLKLRQNAAKIRNSLHITLQVGTLDPLICENEIIHFYLDSLGIPHEYQRVPGASHQLSQVV